VSNAEKEITGKKNFIQKVQVIMEGRELNDHATTTYQKIYTKADYNMTIKTK